MRRATTSFLPFVLCIAVTCGARVTTAEDTERKTTVSAAIDAVQPMVVKIYGAGGFRGLEAYQSGFLVSADGFLVTVFSYVIDTDYITIVLNDGRRFDAEVTGADPRLDLAVLKIKDEVADLPHFDLDFAASAESGIRVLAFSNLYGVATGDEPVSVQHGWVAVKTRLEARRGVFETRYKGMVYILDAMTNNPGAAGGALTNQRGELLGMLGKELKNSLNNTWLNYAIPVSEMKETVAQIQSGEFAATDSEDTLPKKADPLTAEALGLVLVPDILDRTPPFIDAVRSGSPAAEAHLKPDDLVLFVNDRLIQTCTALHGELEYIARDEPVTLTVIRGEELVTVELRARNTDL